MNEALFYESDRFIGRRRELATLQQLLGDAQTRLITLLGPAGIGKTRLAFESAADPAVFDGERIVIGVNDIGSLSEARATLATALAEVGTPADWDDPRWRAALSKRRLLLLLDGCEAVPDCRVLVGELLRLATQVVVLATSRMPLGLRGEHTMIIGPLALPSSPGTTVQPAEVTPTEAVELFIARAKQVQPQFQIDAQTIDEIGTICTYLDGLPLAIELIAAQLQLLPFHLLYQRISRRTGNDQPSDGERALYSAIERSYRLLDDTPQALFTALSVFAGGATLHSIEQVCAPLLSEPAGDVLRILANHSLIQREIQPDGTPRVRLLAAIRHFAAERLAAQGKQRLFQRRHAEHYCALAETAAGALNSAEQSAWIQLLGYEYENLRTALSWSREYYADYTLGLRISAGLARYWVLSNRLAEGIEWLREQLAECETPPEQRSFLAIEQTQARMRALIAYGQLRHQRRNRLEAESAFSEALELATLLDSSLGKADALRGLGNSAVERRDFAQASTYYQGSLEHAQQLGRNEQIAPLHNNLGIVALYEQHYTEAADQFSRALQLYEELGDHDRVGALVTNLGILGLQRGDYPNAAQHLRRSLELSLRFNDAWAIAHTIGLSAELAGALGESATAAWLIGAAQRFPDYRDQLDRADQERFDRLRQELSTHLDPEQYQHLMSEGRAANQIQINEKVFALLAD